MEILFYFIFKILKLSWTQERAHKAPFLLKKLQQPMAVGGETLSFLQNFSVMGCLCLSGQSYSHIHRQRCLDSVGSIPIYKTVTIIENLNLRGDLWDMKQFGEEEKG